MKRGRPFYPFVWMIVTDNEVQAGFLFRQMAIHISQCRIDLSTAMIQTAHCAHLCFKHTQLQALSFSLPSQPLTFSLFVLFPIFLPCDFHCQRPTIKFATSNPYALLLLGLKAPLVATFSVGAGLHVLSNV
ncbi:Uncharacterized protein TCM_012002 [Theobroma cacao]|uniref:Uncharacterized protein n=1 Tax=Theobroma cacao TaxID=3641 RepID=A0A061FU71_THECC|nr:Uncharacterized protein TCM_012002 [Theobroma cacao]